MTSPNSLISGRWQRFSAPTLRIPESMTSGLTVAHPLQSAQSGDLLDTGGSERTALGERWRDSLDEARCEPSAARVTNIARCRERRARRRPSHRHLVSPHLHGSHQGSSSGQKQLRRRAKADGHRLDRNWAVVGWGGQTPRELAGDRTEAALVAEH